MIDEEIGKYKKRTKSNVSKSTEKSKHKHDYKRVLLVCDGKPYRSYVCTLCGKIGDVHFGEAEKIPNTSMYRMLTDEEIFEKYKDLEQIVTDDIWQKFVPISDR